MSSAQPAGQPLFPDMSEQGYNADGYDPFSYDGLSADDSFINPYDQFQPSVAPQSLSMQSQPSIDFGRQSPQYDPYASQPVASTPQYDPYASQPVAGPPQYSGAVTKGSSSPVKKVVFAALDVVLMALLSVAPWLGLDEELAGLVEGLATLSGTSVDTNRTIVGSGLLLINDIARPLRALNISSDPDIDNLAVVLTITGVFLIVLWLANIGLLVATLIFDIKGKSKVFGYILPIVTCFIFLTVLLLIGGAIVSEVGDLSVASDVFSYMLSLTKFGLWATLITSIGGIVARVVVK